MLWIISHDTQTRDASHPSLASTCHNVYLRFAERDASHPSLASACHNVYLRFAERDASHPSLASTCHNAYLRFAERNAKNAERDASHPSLALLAAKNFLVVCSCKHGSRLRNSLLLCLSRKKREHLFRCSLLCLSVLMAAAPTFCLCLLLLLDRI